MEKELTVKGLSLKKETDEIATALAKKIATLTFEYNDVLLKARVSEEEADKFERWLRLAQKNEETTKAYYKSELTTAHLTINSQVKEIEGLKKELADCADAKAKDIKYLVDIHTLIDAALPDNGKETLKEKVEYLIEELAQNAITITALRNEDANYGRLRRILNKSKQGKRYLERLKQ
jgi:hypothetical protein